MLLSAPRTPMIFCATTLVAGSCIIFKLSALQTLSSAPDISLIVSGDRMLFRFFTGFTFPRECTLEVGSRLSVQMFT